MVIKISDTTKNYLLCEARKSIYNELGIDYKNNHTYIGDEISVKYGAFVTLNKNNQLRGCIGIMVGTKPIADTIRDMAKSAAFNDNRFMPVTKEELDNIQIEITILSPLKSTTIDEIEVGRDGLLLEYKGFYGVLLPQVAVNHNWSKEEFLDNLCIKAGLNKNTWREKNITLYRFSGYIFSE